MATGMKHIKGEQLDFGVKESGLSGVLEQSSNNKKLGEIKEFKDKDGKTVSVYVTADYEREEQTFDVILKQGSSVNMKVGDTTTIGGVSGVISSFEIIESNEDAKKARVTVRTYPDIA